MRDCKFRLTDIGETCATESSNNSKIVAANSERVARWVVRARYGDRNEITLSNKWHDPSMGKEGFGQGAKPHYAETSGGRGSAG